MVRKVGEAKSLHARHGTEGIFAEGLQEGRNLVGELVGFGSFTEGRHEGGEQELDEDGGVADLVAGGKGLVVGSLLFSMAREALILRMRSSRRSLGTFPGPAKAPIRPASPAISTTRDKIVEVMV